MYLSIQSVVYSLWHKQSKPAAFFNATPCLIHALLSLAFRTPEFHMNCICLNVGSMKAAIQWSAEGKSKTSYPCISVDSAWRHESALNLSMLEWTPSSEDSTLSHLGAVWACQSFLMTELLPSRSWWPPSYGWMTGLHLIPIQLLQQSEQMWRVVTITGVF